MSKFSFQVLLAPTAGHAAHVKADVSVGAKYGDLVVDGSLLTLTKSHEFTKIVLAKKEIAKKYEETGTLVFLVNDLNLANVGNIAHVLSMATGYCSDLFGPRQASFWRVVEDVEMIGPNSLSKIAGPQTEKMIKEYWAFEEQFVHHRANSVIDQTVEVAQRIEKLQGLLG